MNAQHAFCKGLVIGLCATAFAFSAFAQTSSKIPPIKNRGALYYLGEQDELLIKVNVWGFVQNPGQYMVPNGTDLISLISFAGGPREQAKLNKVKLIRNHALLASRYDKNKGYLAMNGEMKVASEPRSKEDEEKLRELNSEPKVYIVDVKKYLQTGDESLIPELKPGDTVVVDGSTFHFVSKVFDFTSKLAVIAQIYFWIYAARR